MIASLVALASEFGVGGSLLFYARQQGRGATTLSSGLLLVLASSSLAAVLVGLTMTMAPMLLLGSVPLGAGLLALIAVLPANVGSVGRQALLSRGDLVGVAYAQALQALAVLGLVAGMLALSSRDAMGALLAYAVAQVVVAAWVLARLKSAGPLAAPSVRVMRGLLGSGVQMHVGTLALFLAYRLDILLVNHYLGPAAAGVYSIALTVSELIRAIPEVGQMTIYSASTGRDLPDVGPTARATVLATVVGSALVAALNFWAVPFFFGRQFAQASLAFLALVPGLAGLAVSYTIAPLLVLRGRMRDTSAAAALSLALMLALDAVAIPAWGILGAAGASSAAYILLAALQWRAIRRVQPLSLLEILPRGRDVAVLAVALTSWLRDSRPARAVIVSNRRPSGDR
jgi:O-antigen/teichoic acid export membrane protein